MYVIRYVIVNVIRYVYLMNIYRCGKRLFGELVLACEDEILNTTETSLDKVHYYTISLVFICLLLLVVISISGFVYYTKHRSKQKHLLPCHDTKK